MLNPSLSADYALGHAATTLKSSYGKIFHTNNILRDAPPALALEVFNTCVLASANNLMSLFPPNKAMEKAYDDTRDKVARLVLWSGYTGPSAAPVSLSRIAELNGIVARERVRLSATLQQSPFRETALACRVYAALKGRTQKRGTPAALVTWVTSTERLVAKMFKNLGIHMPVLPQPGSHSSASKTMIERKSATSSCCRQKQTMLCRVPPADPSPRLFVPPFGLSKYTGESFLGSGACGWVFGMRPFFSPPQQLQRGCDVHSHQVSTACNLLG
jgi:hypothetical protein